MAWRAWILLLACVPAAAMTPEELGRKLNPSIFTPCGRFVLGAVRPGSACGSAYVVDPRGYLITNAHVAAIAVAVTRPDGAARVLEIQRANSGHPISATRTPDGVRDFTSDDLQMLAEVVAEDRSHDLALLRLYSFSPWPALELGDDKDIHVGDHVAVLGSPKIAGAHPSGVVLIGTVSGPVDWEPVFGQWGLDRGARLLRTSVPIYSGNSGGPVVGVGDGRVLGTAFAMANDKDLRTLKEDDLHYFVAVSDVRAFWKASAPAVARMENKLTPDYIGEVRGRLAEIYAASVPKIRRPGVDFERLRSPDFDKH